MGWSHLRRIKGNGGKKKRIEKVATKNTVESFHSNTSVTVGGF